MLFLGKRLSIFDCKLGISCKTIAYYSTVQGGWGPNRISGCGPSKSGSSTQCVCGPNGVSGCTKKGRGPSGVGGSTKKWVCWTK